jgi:hypothetical protein
MREHPRADHRTVIVHIANSNEEQIGRIARLGAIVSTNPYCTVESILGQVLPDFTHAFAHVSGREHDDWNLWSSAPIASIFACCFKADLSVGRGGFVGRTARTQRDFGSIEL